MMTKKNASYFSPSEHHSHLLRMMPKALAYDGGDVKIWQRKLRRQLKKLLGYSDNKARGSLRVRSLWKREHKLGTIEKIIFSAEPYVDVPAFVCLPGNTEPPYTWFICVQGHTTGMHNSIAVDRDNNARPIKVEPDDDFGLLCMKRGLAALCIEQRAFGERRELKLDVWQPPTCHHPAMQALMLGETLIGERVFDVDRGIDYLATRNDVNMKRIGIMGCSGGGTISMFAAAVLARIRYCMPACYFCTFEHSIMSLSHCWCNYVPGLLKYAEMSDIMGLFAPRPVVVVAGGKDDIFPVDATRREFRKLKKIYRAAGASDRCHLVVGAEGHRFYAEAGWSSMLKELRRNNSKGQMSKGR